MTENTANIGIDKILKALPHRYPFLLVDKVVSLEVGKKIVAIKNGVAPVQKKPLPVMAE